MYTVDDIKDLTHLIVDTINPAKVILFGSYAYGTPTEKSDVDLLVVMPDEELSYEEISELGCKVIGKHRKRPVYIRNDLCIIAQSDYREMQDVPISAVYHAKRKGRVLYDKSNLESNII
jgi:predicted nucleotidyltransferase